MNVLLVILLVICVNLIIFSLNWNVSNSRLPPSYVVAAVWTVLLACMAYAQNLIKNAHWSKKWLIPILFTYCILYPFYTRGFTQYVFISNVFSILLSAGVAIALYPVSMQAAGLVSLTTIWATYATFVTTTKTAAT
jgi:tryptophan-rich sensory protein